MGDTGVIDRIVASLLSIGVSGEAEHGGGGMVLARNMDLSERMQTFKNWGMNTFMRTKQKVKEKLSRTSRTVDLSLEDSIEVLK